MSIALGAGAGGATADTGSPLVGVNVMEYAAGTPPNCYGPSMLFDYGNPGVRSLVREHLAAMRAGGADSIRLFLVYDRDTSENPYFAPARSGRLVDPWRTNLVNYLVDARAAGFQRLTLAFDPRHSAEPYQPWPRNDYDPATFSESWSFIQDVRPLLKRYGPRETRVDLLNEGAPAPGDILLEQVSSWIARMYANYVDAFGAEDVTVSAGWWTGVDELVRALKASGKPLPRWFDVHPRWTAAAALTDLRRVDAELTANGLDQPLVIGEEKYNDGSVAAAIHEFIRTSGRTVEEVMEWAGERGGEDPPDQQTRCVAPPYRLDAYVTALRGAPPSRRLTATVSDRAVTLKTPRGDSVRALFAGSYTVSAKDTSKHRGLLLGSRRTTTAFRGNVVWRVQLAAGTHVFGAVGRDPRRNAFSVLAPG